MGIWASIKGAFRSPDDISAAVYGAYEGADVHGQELRDWLPSLGSANDDMLPEKELLDARGRSVQRNDPVVASALELVKTGVVGTRMVLSSKPDAALLGDEFSEEVTNKVASEIESLWHVYAESTSKHIDASRQRTLTDMVRMACVNFMIEGEFLATVEWRPGQKFGTKIQPVDIARLSNPDGQMDSRTPTKQMIAGIEYDADMVPMAYHIQTQHPSEFYLGSGERKWKRVPARKPWGRPMVIHIREHLRAEQSRGVGRVVSVLKTLRCLKKFDETKLRNATIKSLFVATTESNESPFTIYQQLGMGGPSAGSAMDPKAVGKGIVDVATAHLNASRAYEKSGNVAKVNDGPRVVHLMPGTKFNMHSPSDAELSPEFDKSWMRKIAAALGMSYEELSKDMDKASFAAMKAAMSMTYQTMKLLKSIVADPLATTVFSVWLEEVVERGMLKSLPPSARRRGWIYEGNNLDGLANCSWLGASRSSVNEYQDMQAAKMRLELGLSTIEDEAALLGKDYSELIQQQAREAKEYQKYGMVPPPYANRLVSQTTPAPAPGTDQAQASADVQERLAAVEQFVEDAQNDQ